MLRYKIAPKCLLPSPFGHSDVGGNPGVAGRFVAIISFLHTPVRGVSPPLTGKRRKACTATCPRQKATNPDTGVAPPYPYLPGGAASEGVRVLGG